MSSLSKEKSSEGDKLLEAGISYKQYIYVCISLQSSGTRDYYSNNLIIICLSILFLLFLTDNALLIDLKAKDTI